MWKINKPEQLKKKKHCKKRNSTNIQRSSFLKMKFKYVFNHKATNTVTYEKAEKRGSRIKETPLELSYQALCTCCVTQHSCTQTIH